MLELPRNFVSEDFDVTPFIARSDKPIVELARADLCSYELLGGNTLLQLKEAGIPVTITALPPDYGLPVRNEQEYVQLMRQVVIAQPLETPIGTVIPDVEHTLGIFGERYQKWYQDVCHVIDMIMDPARHHFADGSVGGFFAAHMQRSIMPRIIPEVYRTLAADGFWVVQRMSQTEVDQAVDLGFNLNYLSVGKRVNPVYGEIYDNAVLVKP